MINQNLLLADGGYNLTKSLRFRSSATAYLSKSYIFGTSANDTSLVKKTYSFWMKRGTLGTDQMILSNYTSAGNLWQIAFDTSDRLYIFQQLASTVTLNKATTQVFRDPSAWYHIVIVVDTTLATAEDRFQIWVNNTRVTSWSTNTIAAQNANALSYFTYTSGTWTGNIGRRADALYYFDGYLTEFNVIDGQALTPSSFGFTNSTTGVWQPAKYNGTYGTNGFYLPFTNTTSTSTLGNDFSGNSNTWTVNNISLTSGSTYDSMTDVPTLTNGNIANYCVLNPVGIYVTTPFDGNLKFSGTSAGANGTMGASSGKFYWETIYTAIGSAEGVIVGIRSTDSIATGAAENVGYYGGGTENGKKTINGGVASAYGATWTTNDVIGVALDLDGGTVTFYKNNVSQGAISFTVGGKTWTSFNWRTGAAGTNTATINFGQQPFSYTPPTGFVALNTFNLPTSTIVKGNTVMDATTFTGTGASQSVINAAAFKPDLVWAKSRGSAQDNWLADSNRGANNILYSNLTNAETVGGGVISSFNSNGFGVTSVFTNAVAYVGWQWQAGQGSTSSNTNGSITSTTSVNASAGFSVVTYTGNNTAGATVGHGLGVAPKMIIVKSRSTTATDWQTYHTSLGATKSIQLDSTGAAITLTGFWNDTAPTSSVFSLGGASASGSGDTNGSGRTYVAYCWAEIAGFSKFGSYTGNGSADGPFIYTGFRPKYLMVKNSTTGGYDWVLWDSARSTYNVTSNILVANQSSAETTSSSFNFDFLSNGFKVRASYAGVNESSSTLIYMAFAENPFKNSLAR